MSKVCCFTGHRPQSLPWRFREDDPRCRDLKQRLFEAMINAVAEEGVRKFLSGMALGTDIWAAEKVLRLREELPITLTCVLPCRDQDARWSEEAKRRYAAVLEQCDEKILLQESYTPDCFNRRNRYMVDHSQLLLAVHDGSPGGTRYTIEYALRQRRDVLVLPVPEI